MSALPSASVTGQTFERLAHGLDLLVGQAELVAGKARRRPCSRLHGDVALDGEAGGGRAVEIAAVGLMVLRRRAGDSAPRGGLELEVEALGHEVLDQERRPARWRRPSGRRAVLARQVPVMARVGERQRDAAAAEALVGQREARVLDAVGTRDDDGDGQARRLAGAVAHQRGEVHLSPGR